MATSFDGWGLSWGNSWGVVEADPNAMIGAASFAFHATGDLSANDVVSLGGRDKGALLPVHVRLAVVDEDDALAVVVACTRCAAVLHAVDLDDVLQAATSVAWPEARLVIESVRLLRAPAAPKLARQMALIRDN